MWTVRHDQRKRTNSLNTSVSMKNKCSQHVFPTENMLYTVLVSLVMVFSSSIFYLHFPTFSPSLPHLHRAGIHRTRYFNRRYIHLPREYESIRRLSHTDVCREHPSSVSQGRPGGGDGNEGEGCRYVDSVQFEFGCDSGHSGTLRLQGGHDESQLFHVHGVQCHRCVSGFFFVCVCVCALYIYSYIKLML